MQRRLWLGGVLTTGAVAVVALTAALSACSGSNSSALNSELRQQVDKYAISQIEKDFHEAMSRKNIDQMMSLFAENATFTVGKTTALGKDEIRAVWLKSPTFEPENVWVSDHPAYKLRVSVNGDRGTLYFECHFLDVKSHKVALVTEADQDVARIDGRWLITNFVGGTAELKP